MKRFCLKAPEKGSTFEHAPTGRRALFNEHSVDGDTFLLTDSTGQRTEVRGDDFEWHLVPTANHEIPRFGTVLYDVETEKEIIFLFQSLNSIGITSTSDRQIHLLPLNREQVWFETSRSYPELKEFFLALNEQTNQSNSESDEGLRQVHMLNLYRKGDELFSRICQDQNSLSLSEKAERDDAKLRLALEKAELQKALERPVLTEMLEGFNTNFESTKLSSLKLNNGIIDDKRFDLEAAKFVISWFENKYPNQIPPDMDQAKAIASTRASQLLVARAGSGKTSTLIKRIVFWTQHCGVDPREILVLAFNTKAASEVEERYRSFLSLDASSVVPHIMTFHAMAVAFSPDIQVEKQATALLQQILLNMIREEEYFSIFQKVMRSYFSADLKFYEENHLDLPVAEALRIRRGVLDVALAGHETKSYGEHLIANQLFEFGVRYSYERLHMWGGRSYAPDFTLSLGRDSGIIIEYFGMFADSDNFAYRQQIYEKREYWSKRENWELLEYFPHDITEAGPEGFKKRLLEDLATLRPDLVLQKLSDEEIWQKIEKRALVEFTGVSADMIGRFRKSGLSPEQVDIKLLTYQETFDHEIQVIEIVNEAYRRYLQNLQANGVDDFDGFLERATQGLLAGKSFFERKSGLCKLKNLKQIYIDEFQDFTFLFANMLNATLKIAHNSQLFCVGDDWQAINGFAGSDLQFFNNFQRNYSNAQRMVSTKNYRSIGHIVDFGNAVMHGCGDSARATKGNPQGAFVGSVDLSDVNLSPEEREKSSGNKLVDVILRIFADVIEKDGDLVLLSRTNYVPGKFFRESDRLGSATLEDFLAGLRKLIPEHLHEKIRIATVHSYKGKEAHTIILIDALARRFPLLHPRLKFAKFSGLTEEAQINEDRRLFYVAVTRAKNQLFIITDANDATRFLSVASKIKPLMRFDLHSLPHLSSESPYILVVLSPIDGFSGTYPIKQDIKESGYSWRSSRSKAHQGWVKQIDKAKFNIKDLRSEPWFAGAHGVLVRAIDCGSSEVVIERQIYDGIWKE